MKKSTKIAWYILKIKTCFQKCTGGFWRIDLIVDRNRNALWDRKGSNSATHGGENNSRSYQWGYCFAPFSIPSCFARKHPLLIFCYLRRSIWRQSQEANSFNAAWMYPILKQIMDDQID